MILYARFILYELRLKTFRSSLMVFSLAWLVTRLHWRNQVDDYHRLHKIISQLNCRLTKMGRHSPQLDIRHSHS